MNVNIKIVTLFHLSVIIILYMIYSVLIITSNLFQITRVLQQKLFCTIRHSDDFLYLFVLIHTTITLGNTEKLHIHIHTEAAKQKMLVFDIVVSSAID